MKNKFKNNKQNPKWKGGKKARLERLKNNLKYQLNKRIRTVIAKRLKGNKNGRKSYDLVGYNVEKLKKRLESTMPDGYTWTDFMNGKLEIDHIIPISAFNFDNPENIDFRRCWALSNLQLLPMRENRIKNNKLTESFQPSLRI